jgi:2-polyprenyl-3-methyl-5-hydroxy-6-metoxy-1,4-benzoquinol methylase
MPERGYHEAAWEALAEGLEPSDAALRERWLLARVAQLQRGQARPLRVLDVGCGEGRFAAQLARAGAEVIAADVAQEPLRRARRVLPALDLRLLDPEAELPFEDCGFDVVWAGEVIEHVADTQTWLSELRRVLRSGGSLLLSTPDHGPLLRVSLALSPGRFERCFDPCGEHLRFYTRRTLSRLLADFGFERVQLDSAGGPPGARRVLFASAVRGRF